MRNEPFPSSNFRSQRDPAILWGKLAHVLPRERIALFTWQQATDLGPAYSPFTREGGNVAGTRVEG